MAFDLLRGAFVGQFFVPNGLSEALLELACNLIEFSAYVFLVHKTLQRYNLLCDSPRAEQSCGMSHSTRNYNARLPESRLKMSTMIARTRRMCIHPPSV